MPQPVPTTVERVWVADLDDAFVNVGAGADVDAAFDDAVSGAWFDVGHAGLVASVASIAAGDVRVVDATPVRSRAMAVRAARRALLAGGCEPDRAYALAFAADTGWRRRRVTVRTADPALDVGETAGICVACDAAFDAALAALLDTAGAPLGDDETVESVAVLRVRVRRRAAVVRHAGRVVRRFAVLDGPTIVSDGHPTASAAQRAAATLAVAGGGPFDVVRIQTRDGGPFATVRADRVAQRAALRVVAARPKDPAKLQTAGWVFFGVAGRT